MPDAAPTSEGIAIVGLAGRFPGARDVRELWKNLCAGTESIATFTDEELRASGISDDLLRDPNYVRARAVLDDADKFDAAFFGLTPRDAELTDPQHRVFLECAWHALEDAALDPARYPGSIGIFAGSSLNTYLLDNIGSHRGQLADFVAQFQSDGYPLLIGSDKDYLATRVSYKLDLRGPSLTVQTACSTSLVAVVQAVNALLSYQCDSALAGGVSITFPQARGQLFQDGAILSSDGHCRAFDADATGTVFGHGCGAVVLKRLADAVRDRDHIYAVIKGAAVNNDGAGKVSYMAPSVDGQAEVIALAHALAGITADTIDYVEAHGTATPLGDPIEIAALTQAFRATTDARTFCKLGTIKSNFGHLEAAAGVAGLIKTALALEHAQLPPSLHFLKPNPHIDFANSPFEVVTQPTDWPRREHPRRAGVSSFGVGGTNAHVVVEEAPATAAVAATGPQLIVLSAKTRHALEEATTQLGQQLKARPELALADIAFTLQSGRRAFEHRRCFVASTTAEAAKLLLRRDRQHVFSTGDNLTDFTHALGQQWLAGVEIEWPPIPSARRIPLPGYAFERKRFWIEPLRDSESPSEARAPARPAHPEDAPLTDAQERLSPLGELKAFLAEQSGLDLSAAAPTTSLLELGFDSLFLTQIAIALQRRYGLRITLRQLLGDLADIGPLSDFIAANRGPQSSLGFSPNPPEVGLKSKLLLETPPSAQHGPFRPLQKDLGGALSAQQQRWLDDFILRYTARTPGSKRHTQEHRVHFADPRAVAGFKQVWKEIVYPIVVNRSQGAHLWDIDGHDYVDTTQGFGLALFGHQPAFAVRAIEEQMKLGMEIGPSHPLAGEVAQLLCEITGHERATFCNTGSEAVLGAIRIARTVTGRNKIALFAGAYHGINDEVLVRPLTVNGEWRTAPIAPGIIQDAVDNVLILDYGNPESLDILRRHAGDLAAVLVEPVQSRRPDLQPREFLHRLRALTIECGVALIMDEVITGFRCHPGGAQALFGVKGDIATYGKVIGGGLPIGAITGRAEYMDAFDGGAWQFGDDSYPTAGVTFFAGTFVRHPLALAAAKTVLLYLKAHGENLQDDLTARTAAMIREMEPALEGTPFELPHFASGFFIRATDFKYSGLLYALLRHRGIHIWEGRPCFLGTAHTDADVARIVAAFRESLDELRGAGFFAATKAGALPLTEAQRELWLATQLGPAASAAFNETCTLHFHGAFDEAAMRRAIDEVVARHDALRTRFASDDGAQTVEDKVHLDVPLREVTTGAELDDLLAAEGARAFDLAHGPLVAFQLLKLAPEHHALVFTAHHIACDGWAYDIVLRELAALYSNFRAGQPSPLSPAMQFADYVRWGAEQNATPEAAAANDYWLAQFRTLPAPLDLPTAAPRPLQRSFAGDRAVVTLPSEMREALVRLGAQNGATLFTTLLAGFTALLHRLSGQDDLVIGIPAAGQNLAGGEDLVGHCANLLPLRLKAASDDDFKTLLTTTKRTVLDAMEHQSFTFGTLLQKLKVPRDAGRVPLVPVVFNLDPPLSDLRFDGLTHEIALNPRRHYQFDLGFNVVDESGALRVECDYNADLFDPATISRWLGHYRTLLEAAVSEPDESVARLPLLTGGERTALLGDGCLATRNFAPERCIHELFEDHAKRVPQSIALTFEKQSVTYGELNAQANRLAHHLRALGVGAETRVAICLERSPELLIAILAVLKAGGAYVPLDPDSPGERLGLILTDAQTPVVLTQESLLPKLGGTEARAVCLDRDGARLATLSAENPAPFAQPDSAAYVIYTSGSTGVPKGVVVTHHNVVRLFQATDAWFRFDASDVWTLFHSPAFDFSVWEIWGALANGGRLVIVPYLLSCSPTQFYALLAEEKVTVLNQTPLAFQQFIRVEGEAAARRELALRFVIFGGEALDFPALRPWFERHGDKIPQLVNMYGITETTVHVTYRPVTRADLDAPGGSRIGRAIPDLDLFVLDRALAPCPIGITGELYVGGAGVARGYLHRPELTAERFIPHPWKAGARLYKSGDLGRRTADGDLEYLGRADQQVKVRGFRIELGEIEAALLRHPGVAQCTVVMRELPSRENGLAAYYVLAVSAAPAERELRAFLQERLPGYMLPAAFIPLDALPLNHNGKLNPGALPAPTSATDSARGEIIAPRNDIESGVSQLWAELLGRNSFSVRDDFFAVGGHSLLAIQMLSQLRKKFGVDVPVRRLFDTPTIEGVAEFIAEHLPPPPPAKALRSLITIQRGEESQRPLFLIPGGWGAEIEFLVYAQLKLHLGPDLPIYGLKARGSDGLEEPHGSVREMVVDYVDEIRTRQPHGPYLLAGECIGGVLAYEMARRLEELGESVALLVLLDTDRPTPAALRKFCAEERAARRSNFWDVHIAHPFADHMHNLATLPPGGKLRYIWQRATRQRTFATAKSAASTPLDARKVLAHYPRLLMAHPVGAYRGKLTLLIDETSHRTLGTLGWEEHHTAGVETHVLPGDHLSYIRENATTTAAKLRELIERSSQIPA